MRTGSEFTQEQINLYRQNGYLVVPRLFSPEECDVLLAIIKTHADKDFSAILNLDRTVPELRAVMKDPGIVRILETLQGAEVVGLMSQVLFKEPGSPYAVQAWNPHQDNAYLQAKPGTCVTIHLFLADHDRTNGGLYVYPGSHAHGLLPAVPTVSYHEKPGTNPGNKAIGFGDEDRKVDLTAAKGDLLVLNGNTVHGSYANLSSRSRPLYSIVCITKGTEFIPGKSANRMVIPLR